MTCIVDTASINLTVAAGQLSADLTVDPGAGLSPNPLTVNAAGVYVIGSDGWIPLPATLAFSSADGHTFVATTSVDLRSFIGAGDKIRLVQAGVPAYFFVTAIAAGTITLYGGTNYVLAASAVSTPYFSKARSPIGFNLDGTIWTEQFTDAVDRAQATPVSGTWYNPGSLSIAIPIGLWDTDWAGTLVCNNAAGAAADAYGTLSTANNSESDADFTAYLRSYSNNGGDMATLGRRKTIPLAAKTTYFLNAKSTLGLATVGFDGATGGKTIIRARCAYL